MSFHIGDIVGSVTNYVLPGSGEGGGPVATDPPPLAHEPVHAHLAQESSNPNPPPIKAGADDALLRQGIIIIGGHQADLHPAVASLGTGMGKSGIGVCPSPCSPMGFRDLSSPMGGGGPPTTPPEGGGFSGFLHTIANVGRSGGSAG